MTVELPQDPYDLDYHGDQAVGTGLLDLAVNVTTEPHPAWLAEAILAACGHLAAYPDAGPATEAVAARHGRSVDQTLVTSGAAEAFTLIARHGKPGRVVVVHPQFTEPERALRLAGHQVERHILRAADGFRLDPAAVPADAELVMIGNPTNPTGVLHQAEDLLSLVRPGRLLVVDEAFIDAVPGERHSLADQTDVPGLVVIRSLTKTWGLAGIRIGYLLGPADLLRDLRRQQSPWSVSTPALACAVACGSDVALKEAQLRAERIEQQRETLRRQLLARGFSCVAGSRGPFLLVGLPSSLADPVRDGLLDVVARLRQLGIAVRRADTFPGLDPTWFRIAVRPQPAQEQLLAALDQLIVS